MEKAPRPGEIFYLTKDKPYQIITMGIHKETCESMVIYQALFGDFKTFVLPLSKFVKEMQREGSLVCFTETEAPDNMKKESEKDVASCTTDNDSRKSQDKVDNILLSFLDADTYSQKLEIITTNIQAIDNRLINNMAASLDCTIEEGPLDHRLQELIYCLKQMSRFEDRRLR